MRKPFPARVNQNKFNLNGLTSQLHCRAHVHKWGEME